MTQPLGTTASSMPIPPPPAGTSLPASDPNDASALMAQLQALLPALQAQQQLAQQAGMNGAVAGAGTVGGGAATGAGKWVNPAKGFTVENSVYGDGDGSNLPAPTETTGGGGTGAVPTINMQHILGTPVPGGVIDTIMKSATPNAAMEMSGGEWITITDGQAQMHVHAHGIYAQQPQLIQPAIASGKIQVHLHGDGTLHLHDVMPA